MGRVIYVPVYNVFVPKHMCSPRHLRSRLPCVNTRNKIVEPRKLSRDVATQASFTGPTLYGLVLLLVTHKGDTFLGFTKKSTVTPSRRSMFWVDCNCFPNLKSKKHKGMKKIVRHPVQMVCLRSFMFMSHLIVDDLCKLPYSLKITVAQNCLLFI